MATKITTKLRSALLMAMLLAVVLPTQGQTAVRTRVNHNVTHKASGLRDYYNRNNISEETQQVFRDQGLVGNRYDEWMNADGTQKVNEFMITHYVKQGETVEYDLPTIRNNNNDHRLYQRWYNYNNETDIDGLAARLGTTTTNGGNKTVYGYLYNNGLVTGERIYWNNNNLADDNKRYLRSFRYTNTGGDRFTLAADVSRYSDLTYANTGNYLNGNLEEPTLTMRYIFFMRDAKEMAANLTACTYGSDKWLEQKTIHFPMKPLRYEADKPAAYQGEFIGIRHIFKDYWVFNGQGTGNNNLVPAVTANNAGRIEVVVEPNGTGITLGGLNNKGYYLYDEGSGGNNYGESRFVAFKYPMEGGKYVDVKKTGEDNPAYLRVYFNYNGNRYQIAEFKLIFDPGTRTLPWTTSDGSEQVNGNEDLGRDPNILRRKAGAPIAKVTFDYPAGVTFMNPSAFTIHNKETLEGMWYRIENSSPLPLTFDKTNYGFDGDNPSWGSYALVSTMQTQWGNKKTTAPVDDASYGYKIATDEGMKQAFMYIDASEQPGDICSVDFQGEFCAGDKLMCSGWITGSNSFRTNESGGKPNSKRCPGSVTITVKGARMENGESVTDDIYRFCPGQCYELDNGTGADGSTDATHVVWQQFYFEFQVHRKYERQWIEVNNNCISSNGGDFMLDNIEIYAMVPEVVPEMNTPLCVDHSATELQLLKLDISFDKLLAASGVNTTASSDGDHNFGIVFLKKKVFLEKFREGLKTYNNLDLTLEEVEANVEAGVYKDVDRTVDQGGYKRAYEYAFDAALLGTADIWDSKNPDAYQGAGILNFHWNHNFEAQEEYTFEKAVNRLNSIFRYTDPETKEKFLIMNGNYPKLNWEVNTDYYIIPYNDGITDPSRRFKDFNICSDCNKAQVYHVEPPYHIISVESSDVTQEVEVCEGKVPTLLTDLVGLDYEGNEVALRELNYDWWLGDPNGSPAVVATITNYHQQQKAGTYLDQALSYLRAYYPSAPTLEGVTPKGSLTQPMISYLQELVEAGQLILRQTSLNLRAQKTSADDPYAYFVACPIHDGEFNAALNHDGHRDVAYFCDEPQGLRIKIGETAPTLKCGFVPNQNGFGSYDYGGAGESVLSVRLAKREQFETVQHGTTAEAPVANPADAPAGQHFLWLPIRNAQVQSTGSTRVISKADDYNIYLASTDDPTWDRNISKSMNRYDADGNHIGTLPIVGKIVQLRAVDTGKVDGTEEVNENRLCIYFTTNFNVREGYTYTLSLPFREDGDANACDGTLLLNLKIVPDYQVWTGGAGSTDWNNDQNWRRADGNTGKTTEEPKNGAGRNNNELLVSDDLPATSKLKDYTTNYTNYRSAKDRLLRKGFAPLYCTHILMKSNEWGDAPVLYDALHGMDDLVEYPFPNLSESYTVNRVEYIDERYETIDALSGKAFAIVNEAEGKVIYGTNVQNLGYGNYPMAMQEGNSGYYYTLESAAGAYLLRLQTPTGNNYEFDAWGRHWDGYLNSQPLTGTVSFVLGLGGWDNIADRYGMDGQNLGLWTIEENSGKFALKNVGTGKYLKDNSNARYDEPTYFTFCTLQEHLVPTQLTRYNILKYDMQARLWDIWKDTYGTDPDRGRSGDLLAEMYQVNTCDEIALQPGAELLNAHLLNYNNAWLEYQLNMKRWYLLGSPLQGTIAGEWYAPSGTAQQKTTYYEPVTFGPGYDRYSPAIYQRSWDKAKTVLYEVGSTYDTSDDDQTQNLGTAQEGLWANANWAVPNGGANEYLDRLGYKPMGGNKANVAIRGLWSNTYNDATVDYATGGFSVMVINSHKGNSNAKPALVRLPKEDTMYDYYRFAETGADDGGTDTQLADVRTYLGRAKNRGRLKSDLLLPLVDATTEPLTYQQIQRTETTASRYGDQRTYTRVPTQKGTNALPMTLRSMQESVGPGVSNLGYYLVENPFPCGLDMEQFFAQNTQLLPKYWIMTPEGQQLVYRAADGAWVKQSGQPAAFAATDAKVAPGQGFFVQVAELPADPTPLNVNFTADMQAKTRYGVKRGEETFTIVVGTRQKMTTEERTVTLDDGTTQTVTVEVPEVDDQGNPVIEDITEDITITTYVQDTETEGHEFALKARTRSNDGDDSPQGMVITARRDSLVSTALVTVGGGASDDFLPSEDTELFLVDATPSPVTAQQTPFSVYTLCGRLATTVNSINTFTSLPLGVESDSDAPCTLTFQGVEALADTVALYDARERTLTPLTSDMQLTVNGQARNRYFLVRTLSLDEAATETHIQVTVQGLTAHVVASTQEPLTAVRCYDTAGRVVYTAAPQTDSHTFTLPLSGIYIIEAQTANDRRQLKVIAR